jgi:hypothetical protein
MDSYSIGTDVFKMLPDDDPNMDRNMQQSLKKAM